MSAQGAQADSGAAPPSHDRKGRRYRLVNRLTTGDFRSAIEVLFARTTAGTKFGLERTHELLGSLGDPHLRLKSIHVAGTNGKGSVVAMCDAVLRAKGLRVGRYTSPHLVDFRERVLVDGEPVSEAEVLRFLQRAMPVAERIGATFFEVTTALAFSHFADSGVDVAVIETGLGGRLDSTNVVRPLAAAVTSIGLDHTDLLGGTRELIAVEKAGIFKAGAPAIIGERDPAIVDVLRRQAETANAAPVMIVSEELPVSDVALSLEGTSFSLRAGPETRALRTNLIGYHQAQNAAVAVATVRALPGEWAPAWEVIDSGLGDVALPGRFQRHGKYVFDVAHNPAAAAVLARTARSLDLQRPLTAVVAVLADKDWRGFLREIGSVADRIIVTDAPSAPGERRWDVDTAAAYCTELGVRCSSEPDLAKALRMAADSARTVIVTGSFHTVGDSMSRLHVSPFAA